MSEINKAAPETPISLVVPVLQVPQTELDRLGFAGKTTDQVIQDLIDKGARIELTILRKHLPADVRMEGLFEQIRDNPESQYILVTRPAHDPSIVRQATLLSTFVALIKATNNFNHFDTSAEGIEALREHTKGVVLWWPDYGTFLADARVRILLAVRVMLKLYPNIEEAHPDKLGAHTIGGQVFLSCRDKWLKGGIDDPLPENLQGVWNQESYWKESLSLAGRIADKRNEMYNIDVERRKNPGHYKVGKQWLQYGTVYEDGGGQKNVVVNHNTVKLDYLELFGQRQENRLALMDLAQRQPAVDKINEAGGSMFAAICRYGFKAVETWVDECCKPEDLQKVIENGRNSENENAFRSGVTEIAKLEDVTDEQLAEVIHPPSKGENETLREAFARMIARGCVIEWWATATLAIREKVISGEQKVSELEGAILAFKVPDGFYDGCKKIDPEMDAMLEEMDKNSTVALASNPEDVIVRQVDGTWYDKYDHDPKKPAIDRSIMGWLNPWDLSNPYRPNGVVFVTWDEIKELDKVPETTTRLKRHFHSSQVIDGDEKGEISLDYVILRPESAEMYKAIIERLKELRPIKETKE